MQRKNFIICLKLFLLCSIPLNSFCQDFLGFANSQFAGVDGINLNPAFIVNNPRKWDVTIVGLNFALANNYIGLQKKTFEHSGGLVSGNYPAFSDNDFSNHYLTEKIGSKTTSVFLGINAELFSFMITNPKKMDAFGFTCRMRTYVNIDGVDPTLSHMLFTGIKDSTLYRTNLVSENISAQAMIWNEYGITYGKTISETKTERLNVAGRIKLLQGLYAMYLYIDNISYNFNLKDSIVVISSLVHYGHSTNLEFNTNAIGFGFGSIPGIGFDIGATYEFRPLNTIHSKMASQSVRNPYAETYKYRIGFSVLDIGGIKFLKPQNARDFTAEITNLNFNSLQGSGEQPLQATDDTLKKKFSMHSNDDKFRMNLPTTISLQGDYNFGKNVYVNSTMNYAFQFKNNEDKIHEVTTFSITPRWDWKWIGAYLPFSINKFSSFRTGLSLRLGPLIIGTSDLMPFIAKKDIYGTDFHFLLKVPHIQFKKKIKKPKCRFSINKEETKDKYYKKTRQIKKSNRILPQVKIFKNKRKHIDNSKNRGQIIYFKL
ncbi:MAG: DUF5723 family protein [Bacteroidota bacterium]